MKKRFTILTLVLSVLIFTSALFAQASDTLKVYANKNDGSPNYLNEVVAANPNVKVFKLVSLDTTYLVNDQVAISKSMKFLGVLDNVTKRPPTIQPMELSDASIPAIIFSIVEKDINVTIQNLYILALTPNNTRNLADGIAIRVIGDNVRLEVLNSVFEGWTAFAIGYTGQWDKFILKDNMFRNMVHPDQPYVGEVIRNQWPGEAYTDSLVMVNNTMFCVACYSAAPVTKYYTKYFEFNHNTVVYSFKNPFFIFNATDAKVNNNVFYNAWSGGISKAEYPWWDQLWSPEVGSIIDLDTLNMANAKSFKPNLTYNDNDPKSRLQAEKFRTIEVKNNVYNWSSSITSLWTNWNNTVADSLKIRTVSWMNNRTTNMFTDKTMWPGLQESGNQNLDPQYNDAVKAIVTKKDGFKDWFEISRANGTPTFAWGGELSTPDGSANWVPAWPVSENLAYSNSALMTLADGYPVGDLNWFPSAKQNWITGIDEVTTTLPEEYSLSNNYPNPFNPSTTIDFKLPKTGKVVISVFNVLGQKVTELVNGEYAAGSHKVVFNANNLSSGVYFYTLVSGNTVITKKMLLVK